MIFCKKNQIFNLIEVKEDCLMTSGQKLTLFITKTSLKFESLQKNFLDKFFR